MRPSPLSPIDQSSQLISLSWAVGVVIHLLDAAKFITIQHHWRALREQQRGQHVAELATAKCIYRVVIGGPSAPQFQHKLSELPSLLSSLLASLCFSS